MGVQLSFFELNDKVNIFNNKGHAGPNIAYHDYQGTGVYRKG